MWQRNWGSHSSAGVLLYVPRAIAQMRQEAWQVRRMYFPEGGRGSTQYHRVIRGPETNIPSRLNVTCVPWIGHMYWGLLCMPSWSLEMTLECCPKYKWNHLWPQNPLVWFELEVVLVVSDPETCSAIGMPDCACFNHALLSSGRQNDSRTCNIQN
jgi:hypothetical protein